MIGRNVKPDRLSIREKKFFFGRFVFPPHAARPAEIHDARLDARLVRAFTVALQENGAKRLCMPVVILEKLGNCFCGVS